MQHAPVEMVSSEVKTQSKLLWEMRTGFEEDHRAMIHRFGVFHRYIQSTHDIDCLPDLTSRDLVDICNKSVPVYMRYQNGERRWSLLCMVLHNYVYRRWFRPYRSDIESHRFLCKFITARHLPDDGLNAPPSPSVVKTLMAMNNAVCAKAEALHLSYAERLTAGDKATADTLRYIGRIKDLKFYKIQSLFRALLIIVDPQYYKPDSSTTVGRLPVLLVRTGIEEGLSAPITFESIADKIGGYLHNGEPQMTVMTTLETAIDFAIGLENREREAFGRQANADEVPAYYKEEWQRQWPDVPLPGPSSQWVDTTQDSEWSGNGERCDSYVMEGWEQIEIRREEARRAIQNGVVMHGTG